MWLLELLPESVRTYLASAAATFGVQKEPKPEVAEKQEPQQVKPAPTEEPPSIALANASVTHIRETAKWVVAAFAALAVAMMAGTQLSSIGQLKTTDFMMEHRWAFAFGAGALALFAIGVVVWSALQVLLAEPIDLTAVMAQEARFLSRGGKGREPEDVSFVKNSGMLDAGQTIAQFVGTDDEIRKAFAKADPNDVQRQQQLVDALVVHQQNLRVLKALLRYESVRRAARHAKWWMLGAGFVGGLAIGVFTWAANPPEVPAEAAPFKTPAVAQAYLSKESRERLSPVLGPECVANPVDVLVTNVSENDATVITMPSDTCAVSSFTLPLSEVFPSEEVAPPADLIATPDDP